MVVKYPLDFKYKFFVNDRNTTKKHEICLSLKILNMFKFNIDSKNAKKGLEKRFCFWDNSLWIGCVGLSLLNR